MRRIKNDPGAREAMTEPCMKRSHEMKVEDYNSMYSANYYCGNCGERQTVWFPKAQRKSERIECERCGCMT
jgi:predicted RNA-binding Zn-ribbon protein involved in translation (DUF1610 family)